MREAVQKRRWLRVLVRAGAALLLLLLVLFLVLWYGPSPRTPTEPLQFARDAQGRMVTAGGAEDAPRGPRFEAQAGVLKANNSIALRTGESRGSGARFACRHLAVFNETDHLLMARVGPLVVEQLGKLPYVERIDYYPAGRRDKPGTAAPDIVVRLGLASLRESRGLLSRDLQAEITIQAGSHWAAGSHSYFDNMQPPLVQMQCRGQLEHESTTSGPESSAARYKQAAENIAAQIATKIKEQLDENYQQDGPVPALPAAFYPKYRRPPELQLPAGQRADLMASHHGLLSHTDAIWQLRLKAEDKRFIETLQGKLEKAGWRKSDSGDDYLRMTKGNQVLAVFTVDDAGLPGGNGQSKPAVAKTFYIHYVDLLSRQEQVQAVDELLRQDPPLETLLMFRDRWSPEARQQIHERLERERPVNAEGLLLLAEHYGAAERDKALETLRRATILARLSAEPDDLQQRVRALAKKLGAADPADAAPEPALLREMGFVEIKPGETPPAVVLTLEQPAFYFSITEEPWPLLISLHLVADMAAEGQPRYQLAHAEVRQGMRSWGSGGLMHSIQVGSGSRIQFQAEPLDQPGQFHLTAQAVGP